MLFLFKDIGFEIWKFAESILYIEQLLAHGFLKETSVLLQPSAVISNNR